MTLGERMKGYERQTDRMLIPGIPAVIRLDMRAGHSFCRDLGRPFDSRFMLAMQDATYELCREVTGAVLGYTQSDEISIAVCHTVDEREQEQWFGGRINKIVSLTASICTMAFNYSFAHRCKTHPELHWKAQFDSRAFNVPNMTELHNYFVWRQQDAERNSLNMAARSLYSTEALYGKKRAELHDMLMDKGMNWNDLLDAEKRGTAFIRSAGTRVMGQQRLRYVWRMESPRFAQEPELIPGLQR